MKKKRQTLRRAISLLCCIGMLLPCVPAALAADEAIFTEGFDAYPAGQMTEAESWRSNGNNTTEFPTVVADQAHSGKQSLMLKDTKTETKDGSVQLATPSGVVSCSEPAGTELILTVWYKAEGGSFMIRLQTDNGNADVKTVLTQDWTRLSVINTTKADNAALRVWLVSNAANTGTVYFDDVSVSVLTEKLALEYIDEKIAADKVDTALLLKGLNSGVMDLVAVSEDRIEDYVVELKAAREEKGSILTREQVQNCIDNVNMAKLAERVTGDTIVMGNVGEIPVPVKSLPAGVTAQWAEVSPADKNITISGGKATVTGVPTGADDVYTLTLRLATAVKNVDVDYTVQLKNAANYDQELVEQAKAKLAGKTVIGVSTTGYVAVPQSAVDGVMTQWSAIKSDPKGRLSLAGNALSVNSLPSGFDYDEVLVTLKLTKGSASTELDHTLIVYDKTYHVLKDLPNASLEAVERDVPADWMSANTASAAAWTETVTGNARTGTKSVRVVDTGTGPSMGVRSRRNAVPAKMGYDYVATAWVKGSATADTDDRAGAALYVEFNANATTRKTAYAGPAIPINDSTWTQVSMRGKATATYVNVVGYSYQATISDMYFDDFLLWEITPAGILAEIDAILTGKEGDADTLYERLGNGTLSVSGLTTANKSAYLSTLSAKRAAKGSSLTGAELADAVKTANADVTAADKALVTKVAAQVKSSQILTQAGVIALPEVGEGAVTLKWTAATGNGMARVRVDGGTAVLTSVPEFGGQDESVVMILTISKGSASTTVNVNTTLKAYTKNMSELAQAAKTLSAANYLNGQSAGYVTSDLKELPTALTDGISVGWQVLDSTTLQPSSAVTAAGKVTRPAYAQADAPVILRATLTKGGESYVHDLYIIVAALSADEARTVVTENAGFEGTVPADKFTAPEGWNKRLKWADGKNEVLTSYANIDTAMVFTGKQSLRITADGKMASVQNEGVFTVQEGFAYTLEAMAYTDSGATQPCITMKFWNMEGLLLSTTTQTYAAAPGGTGVWKNLSVSAVAPVGAVQVTAELDGGTKAGVTYFDDVRLREQPIVSNGSFELGTAGWTTAGTVSGGKLTLTAGQSAESLVRAADRGVAYFLSLTADGGKAALRFVDRDGKTLAEYAKDMKSGENAFYAYAPEKTAGVQVVLTGAMTADDVKITRAPSGTAVADGDFEFSANAGMGTPWDLTNAVVAPNTGKSGAGLTVKAGGKAVSSIIPTIDGKSYTFTADVKGKGTMTVGLYNIGTTGGLKKTWTVTSTSGEWNTISYTLDQIPQGGADRNFYEHAYIRVTLTGEAVFDNVKVYSVTKSASNPSVENVNDAITGTFPYNWAPYGKAAAYVANQAGQSTEGLSGLAVELFGLGQGGVRSAMVKDVKGGKAYEATINAKGSGAKLTIEFWDKDFNKLGGEAATINSTGWKEYSVKATAPSGTTYATLSVGGEGTGLVYVDEATLYPVVRSIGTNVQLFLDDWLIADSTNVKRTFHEGEKLDPMIERRWYGSQLWNEEKQIYESWNTGSPNYAMYYYTSTDGVNWSEGIKCVCNETEEPNSMPGPSVFWHPDEPDLNKRYKAIFYDRGSERYVLCTSGDGINWSNRQEILVGWDVIMVSYDEANDEYVCTYKLTQGNGVTGTKEDKRVHSTAVSKDLIHWTEGVRMFNIGAQEDVGDDFLRIDSYGTNIDAMGDSYVGFNERFSLDDADGFGGLMDSNLLFSRDLTEDWQRIYDENGNAVVTIPRGEEGSWDDAQTYPRFPLRMGDETWWYYHGWFGDHGTVGVPKWACISAIKWRLNGYMSLDFAQGGTMTTEQFTLMGDKLHLNAKGELTVELLDSKGAVAATGKFSGDSVDSVITWDKSVDSQLGKTVSLRFTGSNAQLYTLQFEGTIFNDVSTGDWHHRAVHYAVDNGIMGGYGGGKFGPDDNLSRAMVVQMLYNKVGQPKIDGKHAFTDVPADQWFNNAVTWGTRNGVMGGYGGGKFGPNDNVTIEQIAVILWNYSGNPEFEGTAEGVGTHSSWAANGLAWASENGILHGVPFKNATENATRAQAAQMLMNYLRK